VERHPQDARTIPADNLFHMEGPRVFRMAAREAPAVLDRALCAAGVAREQLDLIVPHQTSAPGMRHLERMGFARERTVDVLAEYGNCVAASIPLALAVAAEEGRLQRGSHVLICGTGAGFSAAAAVLRW
jgi:3-oxoacyl-[acyl-carrier-protein] synthase-3